MATEQLQVIINAKDMLSQKLKEVNNTLKQTGNVANSASSIASNATNRISNAYKRVQLQAETAFRNIKAAIRNSSVGNVINESGLVQPFKNAAEKIRNTWQTMIENLKGKLRGLGSDTSVGFNISPTGLAMLDGQIGSTTSKVGQLKNSFTGLKSSLANTGASIKNLANQTGFLGQGFTVLKGALAGVVGMLGYNLVSGLMEGARASINARGNIDAFSKRLHMSSSEINNFNKQLTQYQAQFRKVDMQSVGATALELANKLGVPTNKLADLTKMTAVMSSAFLREGRTSEDAILAVSDALDGQFRRLQEIGITQDMLKANGWNGNLEDTASLIDSINKTMDELGITETAMQVTNLDDAWQVLNVSMSHLLTEIIIPLTPLLVGLITVLADAASAVSSWWASMPDGAKIAILATVLGALGAAIYGYLIIAIKDLVFAWLFAETTIISSILPLVAVGVAIGALVLIVYELGKAMGWWTDGASAMKVIGDALRNAFNQLVACLKIVYNGFMEIISPVISDFWSSLVQTVQPLQIAFMKLWNEILKLGDAFGGASGSGSLFADIGRVIGSVFSTTITIIRILSAVIIPVVTFIVNIIASVIDFLTQLKFALDALMAGDILGFITILGTALGQLFLNIIMNIGQLFLNIITNLASMIGISLTLVYQWIVGMVTGFVSGAVQSVTGFISYISQLPGQLYLWLLNAWNRFNTWRLQVIQGFKTAASNAVNGFISYVQGLPSKFWTWLINTYNKVVSFKNTLVQKIKDAAKGAVDSFKSKITSLPTVMWNELMNVKSKIQNAAGALGSAIKNLGWTLLNNFKSALGIASPGDMSKAIAAEMGYIGDNITGAYGTLNRSASGLGDSILSGFNTGVGNSLKASLGVADSSIGYNVSHTVDNKVDNERNELLKEIIRMINDLQINTSNAANNNNLVVDNKGEIKLKHELTIDGLPESVDEDTVVTLVKQAITEKDTIKLLTNSREFQDMDKRFKTKILKEQARHI